MKTVLINLIGILLISLSSCKDEPFDLTEDPLDGKIGGVDWIYTVGGVGQDFSTGRMEAILVGIDSSDPCSIVNTIRPHITMSFPPRIGNYTLSVDNVQVIFNLEGGTKKLNASGGSLNIVSISGFEVIGELYAVEDDDNEVRGSFLLQTCD
jgi:hypothetical protein